MCRSSERRTGTVSVLPPSALARAHLARLGHECGDILQPRAPRAAEQRGKRAVRSDPLGRRAPSVDVVERRVGADTALQRSDRVAVQRIGHPLGGGLSVPRRRLPLRGGRLADLDREVEMRWR
jgi:hypothetical protein